jgi:predicted homoserine dehydrogenase-like protein
MRRGSGKAVAKRDLKPGDHLDAIGEYTYRAWAMEANQAREQQAIPCGLVENGRVIQPIRKGELLTWANTQPPANSRIAELRQLQDNIVFA